MAPRVAPMNLDIDPKNMTEKDIKDLEAVCFGSSDTEASSSHSYRDPLEVQPAVLDPDEIFRQRMEMEEKQFFITFVVVGFGIVVLTVSFGGLLVVFALL